MRSSLDAFVYLRTPPLWAAFNTGGRPQKSLIYQRRFLRVRFGPGRFAGADRLFALDLRPVEGESPPVFVTRIDQYSHERVRPVVLELICPASMVSPGESVAMSEPIVIAMT
jgi:hypothetical protein